MPVQVAMGKICVVDLATSTGLLLGVISIVFNIQQYLEGKIKDEKSKSAKTTLETINHIIRRSSDRDTSFERLQTKLHDVLSVVESVLGTAPQEHVRSKDSPIVDSSQLLALESSSDITSIFLFSPDLNPDLSVEETREAVISNLRRGVKYCYVYSRSHVQTSDLKRLADRFGLSNTSYYQLIEFVEISPEAFPFGLSNNVAIYEKEGRSDLTLCFAEVPFTRRNERRTWVKLDAPDAREVCAKLEQIKSKHLVKYWDGQVVPK